MNIPAIIDLEASGFGKGSYPIEVAYALADKQVTSYLIRPQPDWQHWCVEAQEIHGISKEQLMTEGQDVVEVALALNQQLEGLTLYSDAWGFDSPWLAKLFDAASIPQNFYLESLNRLLTPEQMERFHIIKKTLWQELNVSRHRAANDAKVLQESYLRVMAEKQTRKQSF